MKNINTKEYWENRFARNWKKSGKKQTIEYAKANISNLPFGKDFEGSILDFGCALGDALAVYSQQYPKAKLIGFDISENAIESCRNTYGEIAEFYSGDLKDVPATNIIIASHVMEHITNDKSEVRELLNRCNDLFVFVPFRENPLYIEHVNYYEENYYDVLEPVKKLPFLVEYTTVKTIVPFLKGLFKFQFSLKNKFSKEIIMFHFKGTGKIG